MIDRAPEMWLLPRDGGSAPGPPRQHCVVALGGDGVGPEVVGAAVRVLRASEAPVALIEPLHGEAAANVNAPIFPPELREQCLAADAVLFGAAQSVSIPILHFLRWEMDTYANLRPVLTLPGVPHATGHGATDLVLVRELSEGPYLAREHSLTELLERWPGYSDRLGRALPSNGYVSLSVTTERATSRIGRYAARLAGHRKRIGCSDGRVTIVTKSNVLPLSDGLFREICDRECRALGGLTVDHLYADEAARRLVVRPEAFDVIVTSNLFGDILSDVAVEAMGGLPLAPSAGIGDGHAYFEPVHGSAPDIAGRGVVNPTGAILSAAMLLQYLGHPSEARAIVRATHSALCADGVCTADTAALSDAICGRLARARSLRP
jgi:isocitrate/isopropylmalate dehydrogenase